MSVSEPPGKVVRSEVGRAMDLNADLGEGCPNDEALLELVTSASVCCGAHAGHPDAIRATLRAAHARGVVVGAHPGYPDREGFGRRPRSLTTAEVRTLIEVQVEVLRTLAEPIGCSIRFLKPHGALYNQAQREEPVAQGVLAAALALALPLLGQPVTLLAALARDAGARFIPEGFPDRRALEDGSLVPRSEPDAVLLEPMDIEANVVQLLERGQVDTLCIHGDEPAAVRNAMSVRAILSGQGIDVRSFLKGT